MDKSPAGARVERDVPYVADGHDRQRLDLYRPTAPGPVPVVVWIHGGGFAAGDKRDNVPLFLVSEDYAVAAINYRLSGHATFPAQIEDCKAAVRWLRAHAEGSGIAPDRIGAWGESAGGHLAALLGTTGHVRTFDVGAHPDVSSRVQAVVDFFGPTDFLRMDAQRRPGDLVHDTANSPESRLVGGPIQERPAQVLAANPIAYVDTSSFGARSPGGRRPSRLGPETVSVGAPPFLIVHGDADPLVPYEQSVLLERALRLAGVPVGLHTVEGGGHGGFVDGRIQDLVLEFLAMHLG